MPKAKRKTYPKKDKGQNKDGRLQLKNVVTSKNGEKGRFMVHNPGSTAELLPPELLELIFKNVESPKDLLSCWNTAGATSAWATALRTTDFYFKLTLPFIMPYLDGNDLLICSSVSKSWNATVDTCIQSAEDFDSDQKVDLEKPIVNKLRAEYLPDFIHKFGLSDEFGDKVPVSPVPFRRTEVNVCLYKLPIGRRERAEQQQQLCYRNKVPLSFVRNNLIKCLDHHGHLIRYLKLTVRGRGDGSEGGSCQKKLNLIRICLKRTPNLRELHICAYYSPMDRWNTRTAEFQVSNSKYEWPLLAHLQVLEFAEATNRTAYASIANAYAPQLVRLRFGFKLKKPHRPLSNQFSCLQKIEYLFNEAGNGMEFAAFIQLNQCPLKQLRVRLSSPDEDLSLEDITGLTNAANAASSTLETLVLYPNNRGDGANVDITKFKGLQLPKLKRLDLNGFGYPSVEFLQSVCPALETLRVEPGLPSIVCPNMTKAGEMYSKLYSKHSFWSDLGDIRKVDVLYTLDPTIVEVDGKRKGVKIRKKIGGGRVRKTYTRIAYKAKLENNSSLDEDEVRFLKPCKIKAPSGRPLIVSKDFHRHYYIP